MGEREVWKEMRPNLCAVVLFTAVTISHGLLPPPTAQEEILQQTNTGNFACKVDSVDVTLDIAGAEEKTVITTDDLKSALSRTATLEWAHVNQFFFASADGRNDEKILGTGGGDMGE